MTFSPTDHLGAATRTVTTVTRDDAELRLVTVSRTYDATPDEVWAALVDPERIPRWLGPVEGDLRVGGRFALEGNASGDITTCDRPERLSVTWEHGGDTSWVDVSLRPTPDGTVLQLDHSFAVTDHYRRYGPGATGIGWELALMGLSLHLADPTFAHPAPDELPPGLAEFNRAAATAWGEAAVAGGDDAAEADLAARRCAAAYTGEPEPEA